MTRQTVCIICNGINTINFRGPLIQDLSKHHDVHVLFPFKDAPNDLETLESWGIQCHDLFFRQHGMNPLVEYKIYQSIKKTLNKIQPSRILNYTVKPVIWGSLAARGLRSTTVFSLIAGRGRMLAEKKIGVGLIVQKIFINLYKTAMLNNKHVLFLNPDDQAYFLRNGLIQKKQALSLKSEGVCLQHFKMSTHFPENKIVFFMMARVMKEKGVFEFISAANALCEDYSNVEFRLAGAKDSSLSKKELGILDAVSNTERIHYLGAITNVVSEIENSSVFVLPSYYQEGLPRSILEAMAMGRPIITTDWTGCRETVEDGQNGYLVKIKSVDDLIEKMELFISEKGQSEHLSRLGACSRRLVEQDHDVTVINKFLIQLIGT